MSYIFISHSTDDNEFTRHLDEKLTEAGFETWVDLHNIGSGERWLRSIQEAIENCGAMVVVMSKSARNSEWVEREALLAMDLKKPIHTALIEDIPLPLHLINRQFTNFHHDPQNAIDQLIEALWNLDITAVPKQIPRKLSPLPDDENFFEYLEQLPHGEQNCLIAQEIYQWAVKVFSRVDFGGKITPGFHARLEVGSVELTLFSLWAYPKQPAIQIQFQYLADYEPYNNPALRRSTLRSLNRLLNQPLDDDKADRRPTLALYEAFNTAEKLELFQEIIQEMIDNLRGV